MSRDIVPVITTKDRCLRALQDLELEILMELDRVCRKHGIEYTLGGGTCLGRVRHGGFIPWDDDIDVDMIGDQFDRFMEIAPQEIDQERFFLRCRQTDPTQLRTMAKLELRGTQISNDEWDRKGLKVGIFIDICRLSYLPDDARRRKEVTDRLFMLRCVEDYKKYGTFANKMTSADQLRCIALGRTMSASAVMEQEDKLTHCCEGPTSYLIDDSIINGNYGGYPSEGCMHSTDVQFEGRTVMDKESTDSFLTSLYGRNYGSWLPPVKRISHHNLTVVDFGEYAEKYGLPENYQDYFTIEYTEEKLRHMEELSLEMLSYIDDICTKNGIRYYVAGNEAFIQGRGIDAAAGLWNGAATVAMPREDFARFDAVCRRRDLGKYFYQSTDTDPAYKRVYPRLRLRLTFLREIRIPRKVECHYNDGFYVNIVPLDFTSSDEKERKDHIRDLRRLNDLMVLKWTKTTPVTIMRMPAKKKAIFLSAAGSSVDSLRKKALAAAGRYKTGDYYIDSSGYALEGLAVPKEVMGEGVRMDFLGHELMFPADMEAYIKAADGNSFRSKSTSLLKDLADGKISSAEYIERLKEDIGKKHRQCHLNYFDIPDHQLTVLRYDEKENRLMSNEELLEQSSRIGE